MKNDEIEQESLKDEMRNLIEEARMLLPGIQALFGFQTIAVFNQRFGELPLAARDCHLLALAMVVLAMGLVMTPAAYHRIAEPGCVSRKGIRISSILICAGLAPLAVGVALDMYVVLVLATASHLVGIAGAAIALLVLFALWFAFPFGVRRTSRRAV
jgi:hypothetical protein